MTIVHLAPFDASRYPPLINTVRVCQDRGLRSVIIAAAPTPNPQVFGDAQLICPSRSLPPAEQLAFLIRGLWGLDRRRLTRIIAHNIRGLAALTAWPPAMGKTLIYHCHDFEFDEQDAKTPTGALLLALERLQSRRVDEVWVPAQERIETALLRRLPRPRLVKNCPRRLAEIPRDDTLRRFVATNTDAGARRIIVRHGNIGPAHCIPETIEALPMLPQDVVFVAIGDGAPDFIEMCWSRARSLGVANRFLIHPFVPHDTLLALISGGDVGMCLYAPVDMNSQAPAPNKVYESLAVGMPVVVTSGNSIADEIRSVGAGLAVELGSARSLADALNRLLAKDASDEGFAARARRAHLDQFNYETQLENTLLGPSLRSSRASQSEAGTR